MKQIIIIGWWSCFDTKEAFNKVLETRNYDPFVDNKKRKNRIEEKLIKTHQTFIPEMPCKQNADYNAWKIWFEKIFPFLNKKDTILIWHSLWGTFIIKWLTENQFPQRIKQIHLVSPAFNNKDFDEENIWNFLFNPDSLSNIESQCEQIFLYHSKDDDIVPFSHSEKYKKQLPNAKLITFKNRWHFRQETFPELLENILKN